MISTLEEISQDELQTALKKASDWTPAGPVEFRTFYYFKTAQTYLLAKNKDTVDLKNYRELAYFTSYKVVRV